MEALTNPVSSSSSSRRDDGRRVAGAEEGAGGVGALGVDLTSDAEQAKIASRAERFGTTRTGPIGTDLIPSDELAEILMLSGQTAEARKQVEESLGLFPNMNVI